MKKKLLIACLIACLSSCATTTFYHDGKRIASFQGDMTNVEYKLTKDGALSWRAMTVDHSAGTIALGKTTAGTITAGATIPLILR